LIRCLPQLKSDEKNPNVVDDEKGTKGHEITHAPDALRYFCIMRHRPSDKPVERKYDYFRDRYADEIDDEPGEPSDSYIYMNSGGFR
jgi:hypothetical protein